MRWRPEHPAQVAHTGPSLSFNLYATTRIVTESDVMLRTTPIRRLADDHVGYAAGLREVRLAIRADAHAANLRTDKAQLVI